MSHLNLPEVGTPGIVPYFLDRCRIQLEDSLIFFIQHVYISAYIINCKRTTKVLYAQEYLKSFVVQLLGLLPAVIFLI